MQAEYFPPKEDVLLQNEAPNDIYILVSGTVVSKDESSIVHKLLTMTNNLP